MNRRLAVASLLALALVSGAVVAEAERNYAAVTDRDATTATVADALVGDGRVAVDLRVYNSMNEALRVEYVHLSVARPGHIDGAATPFGGRRTLAPGENALGVGVPARQVSGEVAAGEAATISGEVAVSAYNEYRFAVPIPETEVTL